MRLRSIAICNFLSFREFRWAPINGQCSVIVGPNGSGKTNLFWAIRAAIDALHVHQAYPWGQARHLGAGDPAFDITLGLDLTGVWERNLLAAYFRACLTDRQALQGNQSPSGLGSVDADVIDRLDRLAVRQFDQAYLAPLLHGQLVVSYREDRGWTARYEAREGERPFVWRLAGDGWQWLEHPANPAGHRVNFAQAVVRGLGEADREALAAWLHPGPEAAAGDPPVRLPDLAMLLDQGAVGIDAGISQFSPRQSVANLNLARLLGLRDGEANNVQGYLLFSRLLDRAFAFTSNVRREPALQIKTADLADAAPVDLSDGAQLGAHLFRLKTGDRAARDQYRRIEDTFRHLTGACFDVGLDAAALRSTPGGSTPPAGELYLRLQTVRPEGDIPLAFSGAGIAEALFLSALMQDEDRIVLLDEPAQTLHPTVQTAVLQEVRRRAKSQFIIATHSPALVPADALDAVSRFYLLDGVTKRVSLDRGNLGAGLFSKLQRELRISGDTRALLFAKGVLLVEGESELAAVPAWYEQRFGRSLEQADVAIRQTRGVQDIVNYARLLDPLRIRWAAICDGDAVEPKKRDQLDIAAQMRKQGLSAPTLDGLDFEQRRGLLTEAGIFTFASCSGDAFEAIPDVQQALPSVPATHSSSRARQASWIADAIPCPETVAKVLKEVAAYLGA